MHRWPFRDSVPKRLSRALQESKAIDESYDPSGTDVFYTTRMSQQVTPEATPEPTGALAETSSMDPQVGSQLPGETLPPQAEQSVQSPHSAGMSGESGFSGNVGATKVERDARDVMREAVRRGGQRGPGVPVSIPEEESAQLSSAGPSAGAQLLQP